MSQARSDIRDAKADCYIGQYFLTFDDERCLEFHGQIIGCPGPGFYVVQFFSAFTHEPTDREIMSLAEMVGWVFYPSAEQWQSAYCDHSVAGGR